MLRKNSNIQKMIDNSIVEYDGKCLTMDLLWWQRLTTDIFPGSHLSAKHETLYNKTVPFDYSMYDYLYICFVDYWVGAYGSEVDDSINGKPTPDGTTALDCMNAPGIYPTSTKYITYVSPIDINSDYSNGIGGVDNILRLEIQNGTSLSIFRDFPINDPNILIDRSNGFLIYGLKKNFKTFYQNMVKLYNNIINNIRNLYNSPLSLYNI